MKNLLIILIPLLSFTSSPCLAGDSAPSLGIRTAATEFVSGAPEAKPFDPREFAAMAIDAKIVAADPSLYGRAGAFGNAFACLNQAGGAVLVTAWHCLPGRGGIAKIGTDIASLPNASSLPARTPRFGTYREGENVLLASWVPENGSVRWWTDTVRSRKIPEYRAKTLGETPYGRDFPGLDPAKLRIAEVSKIGDRPAALGAGMSGSPVYQMQSGNPVVVGVIVAAPGSPSLISDGVIFELVLAPPAKRQRSSPRG
jgi:hypothetical protein